MHTWLPACHSWRFLFHRKLGRKRLKLLSPSEFANTVKVDSCSASHILKEGTYVCEQDYDEFGNNENNKYCVGPYFGVTCGDNLSSKYVLVDWFDKKVMKIPTINVCLVPPPEDTTKGVLNGDRVVLTIKGYSGKGVSAWVQKVLENKHQPTSTADNNDNNAPDAAAAGPVTSTADDNNDNTNAPDAAAAGPVTSTADNNDNNAPDAADLPTFTFIPDRRWTRFRRPSLSLEETKTLRDVVDVTEFEEDDFDGNMWICFVDRVAREYFFLHSRHGDSLHCNRESLLKSAVAVVQDTLRPRHLRPFDGDKTTIVSKLQPWIEKIFSMPGEDMHAERGTTAWINARLKHRDYTLGQASEYKQLLDDFVKYQVKNGDKNGYPILTSDNNQVVGPDTTYDLCVSRVGMPRSKVCHS